MKRADGTALSVIVVLFDHNKSLRNHRDTRTLEHYPILSRTISVMPGASGGSGQTDMFRMFTASARSPHMANPLGRANAQIVRLARGRAQIPYLWSEVGACGRMSGHKCGICGPKSGHVAECRAINMVFVPQYQGAMVECRGMNSAFVVGSQTINSASGGVY